MPNTQKAWVINHYAENDLKGTELSLIEKVVPDIIEKLEQNADIIQSNIDEFWPVTGNDIAFLKASLVRELVIAKENRLNAPLKTSAKIPLPIQPGGKAPTSDNAVSPEANASQWYFKNEPDPEGRYGTVPRRRGAQDLRWSHLGSERPPGASFLSRRG